MIKKVSFYGLISILVFGSCSVPDKDSPMMYFYIRFATGIERNVLYNTDQDIFEIPNYISFENRILSRYSHINPVSLKKYYAYNSSPFEYIISIKLFDQSINEIRFIKCNLIINEFEINLFDTTNENIRLSELIHYHNGGSIGRYRRDFFEEYKFIVNNTTDEYYSGFTLRFMELPFDYLENEFIKIKYYVEVIDDKENISCCDFEIIFNRKYVERDIKSPNSDWNEISIDEWKEYLE